MKIEVKIPQQGLTTETVTIMGWDVKEGDIVKEGDVLLRIESEKAALEVEAPIDGKILEILKQESEEARVGEVVVVIER